MVWRFPTDQFPTDQSYVIKYSQGVAVPMDQVSMDKTYLTKYSQGVEVPNDQSYVIKYSQGVEAPTDQVHKKYRVLHNGLTLLCILWQGGGSYTGKVMTG